MIDLYYWPTPNGWKATIMLAECGLAHRVIAVDIGAGEQFAPTFVTVNPNGRIPAIVDHEPLGGDMPMAVFESGAILMYLAEKTGRLLPADPPGRYRTLQWLMWQIGGLGPMAGQNGHFSLYAKERIPYAIERYATEVRRLYAVLDHQLASTRRCVAGDYSIADIAIFPWIVTHKAQGIALDDYPHVARWFAEVRARPAVVAGMEVLRERRTLNKPPRT